MHRWSGQVIETPDGLPYIGQSAEHQHSATGFAGNGLTFGTLAGVMIADAIVQRSNPWSELFDPGRKALSRGLWDYLRENVDYPYYLIRDRFAGAEAKPLRAIERGQGKPSSNETAPRSRPIAMPLARSRFAQRSAPTWAAPWPGTRRNGPGIARVTAHDSRRPAR